MTATGLALIKALIVEDDAMIAWGVESVLRDLGLRNIVVAGSSTSARVAAARENLGLIVCDLNLGPLSANGFELLAAIDPSEQIPTIIHTAYSSSEVAETIVKCRPAALVVHKPATSVAMDQAVRACLKLPDCARNVPEVVAPRHRTPVSIATHKTGGFSD